MKIKKPKSLYEEPILPWTQKEAYRHQAAIKATAAPERVIYKAISLYQPFASYIADGRKTIETRDWYTGYRGDILICSTRKPVIKGMPCGFALCIVELYACKRMKYADDRAACCPWRYGAWSWFLRNIRRISPPFMVRGRQGIYEIELPGELIRSGDAEPKR